MKITKAIEFAIDKHGDDVRKGSTIPYYTHPIAVMNFLMMEKCSDEIVIAGVLHDTLEDTGDSYKETYDEIVELFGIQVADLVKAESEPENLKKNSDEKESWKERKTHTIEHLKEASKDVKMICCADKLHNIISIKDDISLGVDVWAKFNSSKENIKWYYESIVEVLQELSEVRIYKMLKVEVNNVFN